MTFVKDLKKRIATVKNIGKVTETMRLISTSRFQRISSNIKNAQDFFQCMSTRLQSIYYTEKDYYFRSINNILKNYQTSRILIIIIGSDKGLCGGFNNQITKKLFDLIDIYNESNKSYNLICLGKRVYESIKCIFNEHIIRNFSSTSDKNTHPYINSIKFSQDIVSLIKQGDYSDCVIIYTNFITTSKQEPRIQSIKSLLSQDIKPMPDSKNDVLTLDNKISCVLSVVIEYYLHSYFYLCYTNSLSSEEVIRMISMNGATENAKDVLKNMLILQNRKRQSLITGELIEIISGVEAMNHNI